MEWTHKNIQKVWPKDIPYSIYKSKIIKKIIKDKYHNYAIPDLVKVLIKEKFLNFKPSKEEFDCERVLEYTCNCIRPIIKGPYKVPDLCWPVNGGFRNIRKTDMFS